MRTSHDIAELKSRTDCRALARAFGLSPDARGMVRCFVSPQSHSNGDRTPSCSLRSDGFRCFGCGESGDAFDLVRAIRGCDFRTAVDAVREFNGSTPAHGSRQQRGTKPRRVPPPRAELRSLWESAMSVASVPEVGAWLRERRGIDPYAVEEFDLARAIPLHATVPRWARFRGAPWPAAGFRLLVPCFDAAGNIVSMRARRITSEGPKEVPPTGHRASGVMAGPLARLLLAGRLLGDDETAAAELVAEVGIVICEGSTDFLSWGTCRSAGDESAPAVIGMYSGAWTQELADRVPDGTRVTIATDGDAAGERYACRVLDTLGARHRAGLVRIARWRAEGPNG